MNLIHIIILSVVEGITEFLPISSTGHLILTSHLLQIAQSEFLKTFEIAIQLGAIFAVIFLYWRKFIPNLRVRPSSRSDLISRFNLQMKLLVAFIPTAIVGAVLYPLIKSFLLGSTQITLITLFLGGIFLIFFEKYFVKKEGKSIDKLTFKDSFLIGLAQSVSVVPGVSRAAATIVGGMFTGLNRVSATEFSFLLAVPTMAAATGLDIIQSLDVFTSSNLPILGVGFIVSFIVAWISVKFLLNYVKKSDFTYFGIYRVVLSVLYWFLILR